MVAVCLLGVASTAAGGDPCTKFFVAGGKETSLSWHVDTHWYPVGVPGSTDVACILEAGSYEVTVTEPVEVVGLQLDALTEGDQKLKIIDTDFTLNGPGYVAGSTKLKVNDTAVLRTDGGGQLEVHSTLVIEGGTVEVDVDLYGHLNWWGEGSLTGELTTHPGCVIEVESHEAEAHLTVAEGFDNLCSLAFNDRVNQSLTVTSGSLVNTVTGIISTNAYAGLTTNTPELLAELDNRGLIDVNGIGLRVFRDGSQHQNGVDGTIQVTGAELEIDFGGVTEVPSNFTNYGTITVADGGSIGIVGFVGPLEVPSNFTNYGTVTVADGGSFRVVGPTSGSSTMAVVNWGLIDLEVGGIFALTDAVFDNPSSGEVSGSGILDLTEVSGVTFDGTLSPGHSPGILTVDGSMDVGTNTRVDIEVGGVVPGSNLDRLDFTGNLGADGELDVALINPYHPVGGERFHVLTYDHLDGWFSKVTLPPLMHLLAWNVDVGQHEVGLEVVCQGTQVGIEFAADRNPVSIGYEVIYRARVSNSSQVTATDLVISNALPAELSYRPDLSSSECVLVGSTVECHIASLAPMATWDSFIGAESILAGTVESTGQVDTWECDTDASDDQATATIEVVAAEPCDANYDLSVDPDDLVPAVGHIFGERADGNPDCRLANGITADDLAAIIEASQ